MNRCCPWRKAAVEEMEFLTSILGCVSLNFPLNLDFFRQLSGGLNYSYYHYTAISIPILCYSINSVHEEVSHVLSLPVFQFCPPSVLSTISPVHHHQFCPLSVLSISPVHHHLCPPSVLSTISSVHHQSCPAVLSSPILSLQAVQCLEYCLPFLGMISF